MCNKSEYRYTGVRIHPQKIKQSIQKIEKAYASFFPDNIFEYNFLDENIAQQYVNEQRLSSLTNIFSGIAIFISSLGLYGLISFMAVQRTKEVGVRKVLGATVPDILMLFYKEFIFLVLIAFAISAPAAWYFMSGWLNGFAYRIDLNIWTFAAAIVLSLVIALATVSFQSIKAAIANPVDSLRNE
jgi:ABC-type antimicrobial peptide transport system permease subunit